MTGKINTEFILSDEIKNDPMKKFLCAILFACLFTGCCMTGTKCDPDQDIVCFRILNAAGEDLVFGPSKVYDKDSIQFFSLNGADTVKQSLITDGSYLQGCSNSLLIDFNSATKNGPVYVRLNDSDIDTLNIYYERFDGGKCCGAYRIVHATTYNNKNIEVIQGFAVLKK
ncbi:hypothetical protein CHU_2376 [Cytophaga hutchinsonii ATCC 33406]|uniref:Uncharacterized protein n=2 Tax=Cytophaga hutchinsonii TaxID=985 RepID=A0A6N4STT3_CYTH3|nr:hypothetical protein CHU_2376 [Cytophaga hutchinsonii ATCC 33406]